ncbi:MAG: metallopeptidase [Lachnospiraceae bacterium]|nr:metallopeptidase [Lachnospiraceae bacterium]
MVRPIQEEQELQLKKEALGLKILSQSQSELHLNMRFLDVALGSLPFVPGEGVDPVGTEGEHLYFLPESLFEEYQKGRAFVTHLYLHTVFHCLFAHPFFRKGRDQEYWNLACDVAAEALIDSLYLKCVHLSRGAFRASVYAQLKEQMPVLTAEGIYRELCKLELKGGLLERWKREFHYDDHSLWESENPPAKQAQNRKKWDEIRERMQTELELFSKEASQGAQELLEQVRIENRTRYDYREFLRKFAVLKEEIQVDLDSFDYIFYNYGMSLYGNMPLIEPQETKEIQKIEEFVIVIDTSMSCKGHLVRRFLEETYSVLRESESFFHRLRIHIIQCDEMVRADDVISDSQELKNYMEHFTVKGEGGTDFRPAFAYVEELLAKKEFHRLRGLLYFTDGYGTFPVKMPSYETVFIFMKEDYRDVDVPPWAIKLILDPEEAFHHETGEKGKGQA